MFLFGMYFTYSPSNIRVVRTMDEIKIKSIAQGLTGNIMRVLDEEKVGAMNLKTWDRIEELIKTTIREVLDAKTK